MSSAAGPAASAGRRRRPCGAPGCRPRQSPGMSGPAGAPGGHVPAIRPPRCETGSILRGILLAQASFFLDTFTPPAVSSFAAYPPVQSGIQSGFGLTRRGSPVRLRSGSSVLAFSFSLLFFFCFFFSSRKGRRRRRRGKEGEGRKACESRADK